MVALFYRIQTMPELLLSNRGPTLISEDGPFFEISAPRQLLYLVLADLHMAPVYPEALVIGHEPFV
jgi:hypothetical protein